jgi:hypothetical protein
MDKVGADSKHGAGDVEAGGKSIELATISTLPVAVANVANGGSSKPAAGEGSSRSNTPARSATPGGDAVEITFANAGAPSAAAAPAAAAAGSRRASADVASGGGSTPLPPLPTDSVVSGRRHQSFAASAAGRPSLAAASSMGKSNRSLGDTGAGSGGVGVALPVAVPLGGGRGHRTSDISVNAVAAGTAAALAMTPGRVGTPLTEAEAYQAAMLMQVC